MRKLSSFESWKTTTRSVNGYWREYIGRALKWKRTNGKIPSSARHKNGGGVSSLKSPCSQIAPANRCAQVFVGDHCEQRMRSESCVIGCPPTHETTGSFISINMLHAFPHPHLRFRTHHDRLDHIGGRRYCRSHQPRSHSSAEMRKKAFLNSRRAL